MKNIHYTLTPAYGRDYTNKAYIEKDLRNGKDFILNTPLGTTYCSILDFHKGETLNVRYMQKYHTTSFTLTEDGEL
jgi:hypothetical protein